MRRRTKWWALVAAVLGLGLGGAPPALAQVTAIDVNAGVLTLTGSAGNDAVSVAFSGTTMTISDPGGVASLDVDCAVVSATVRNCGPVTGTATFNLGTGTDSTTFAGDPTSIDPVVNGEGDADNLTGSTTIDTLNGGTGVDTLDGGPGNDQVNFGDGDETATGSAGTDTIHGDAGNDTLTASADGDTLFGDAGADVLTGSAVSETLNGGADGDVLSGGASNDTLNGDAGNDVLNGGPSGDSLNGGDDDDTLNGDEDSDTLNGGNGTDTLNGGLDSDTLDGGLGADAINGGPGGSDRVNYSSRTAGVAVTFDGVANDGEIAPPEGDNVAPTSRTRAVAAATTS